MIIRNIIIVLGVIAATIYGGLYLITRPHTLTPTEALSEFRNAVPNISVDGFNVTDAIRSPSDYFGDYSFVISFNISSNRIETIQKEFTSSLKATNSWEISTSPYDIGAYDKGLCGEKKWIVPAGASILKHYGPGDRYKMVGIDYANRVIFFYCMYW